MSSAVSPSAEQRPADRNEWRRRSATANDMADSFADISQTRPKYRTNTTGKHERPYVRRSAHYTPLALLYYKVVSEWETKRDPYRRSRTS